MNAVLLRFSYAYHADVSIHALHLERESLPDDLPPARNNRDQAQRGPDAPRGRAPSQKPLPPPPASRARAHVRVVLSEMNDFDDSQQWSFRLMLARYAKIGPHEIRLIKIEPGSSSVTIELPESTAHWLVQVHQRRELLVQMLGIQDVRDLWMLPQPGVGGWLKRLLYRFGLRAE